MKSNIKEEIRTKVLRQELLNDNSLLEVVKNMDINTKRNFEIRVRYVDRESFGTVIKEDIIAHFSTLNGFSKNGTIASWYSNNGEILEFNSNAVAYFKKAKNNTVYLSKLYTLENHEFVLQDKEKTASYKKCFSKDKVIPKIFIK